MHPAAETMRSKINQHRAYYGLPPLELHVAESEAAQKHSDLIRDNPNLLNNKGSAHSPKHFRPGWAELTGYSERNGNHEKHTDYLLHDIFEQFRTSPNGHERDIRGNWTHVAVGVSEKEEHG